MVSAERCNQPVTKLPVVLRCAETRTSDPGHSLPFANPVHSGLLAHQALGFVQMREGT